MGIKLGLAGLGAFGTVFAPLFASHPLVDAIYLCDAEAEKIKQNADILVVIGIGGSYLEAFGHRLWSNRRFGSGSSWNKWPSLEAEDCRY